MLQLLSEGYSCLWFSAGFEKAPRDRKLFFASGGACARGEESYITDLGSTGIFPLTWPIRVIYLLRCVSAKDKIPSHTHGAHKVR